eukprot:9409689-Alexandrium_andersonii.AAC.1
MLTPPPHPPSAQRRSGRCLRGGVQDAGLQGIGFWRLGKRGRRRREVVDIPRACERVGRWGGQATVACRQEL